MFDMLLKAAKDKAVWEQIRTSENYEPFRRQLSEFYREMDGEIPVLYFQDFQDYFRTGTRLFFEKKYFLRRGQLLAAVGMYLIERKSEYLKRVENVLWAICDEYTWSLPAHIPTEQKNDLARGCVDLFAGETSFALSEISCLLEDELEPWLLQRIKSEIEQRIILPYESRQFFWENVEMNWAAVCCGSVGACYLYLFPERFPKVKQRIIDTMKCFLNGFGTDGCCREGMSYWNYGFGFFTYFADLLFEFTDGAENLFAEEQAENAARFQQNVFMNPSTVVSFADCGPDSKVEPGIISYLSRRYSGKVFSAGNSADFLDLNDRCRRWTTFVRNLVWTDLKTIVPHSTKGFHFFEDAQWYINHNGPFTLAAKGGHNDEPHNHNDLGGIILADDVEQLLCDFGSGLYTHAYFQPETRYDVISNASAGHSVPIIAGTLQAPGVTHCAKVLHADKTDFSVDIAGAYDLKDLKSAVRTLHIQSEVITLRDCFEFAGADHSVTERFITKHMPIYKDGKTYVKSLQMCSEIQPEISQVVFTDHFGKEHTYYTIDYVFLDMVEFNIEFKRSEL